MKRALSIYSLLIYPPFFVSIIFSSDFFFFLKIEGYLKRMVTVHPKASSPQHSVSGVTLLLLCLYHGSSSARCKQHIDAAVIPM